jgi:hypothetical protein
LQNLNNSGAKGKSTEVIVMEYLAESKAKGFPMLIAHGKTEQGFEYFVMDQLGPNLKQLLHKS